MGDNKAILKLLYVTLAFCTVMGAIGYVVTRFPGLLDSAGVPATMVNGIAVSVPVSANTEPQTLRCRMGKEFVLEANSNQVRTTVQTMECGHEPTVEKSK
jgi:hypothetical protein